MKIFQQNGHFVISLDFELLWGVFDVLDYKKKIEYFENTRRVVPTILKQFQKNEIHATWAIVGMLFHENWEEWENNIPESIPEYCNSKLSAYKFGENVKSMETEKLCFAPTLIQEISKTPGQEIGTHTYSHYYCLEPGQDLADFKNDLKKAVELAKKMDIGLKSLVFPRNQLRKEYLQICEEMGIFSVRSNPEFWYWKDTTSEAFLTKLARTGDAYFSFGKKSYPLEQIKRKENGIVEQPASRFLRPPENNRLLRKLKMRRVKKEMTLAAKNNEVYHLWWHPHNFGDKPAQAMEDLKEILNHYQELHKTFGFQSANMEEIQEILLKKT